jgi:hypothetical protein
VAGIWAVGLWLGYDHVVALAGTSDGQDRALIRTGAFPMEGLPPLPVPEWDDEVRALVFPLKAPAPRFGTLIMNMAFALGLEAMTPPIQRVAPLLAHA